jgi:hypothetical protein
MRQEFVDSVLDDTDQQFIRVKARRLDSSKLEVKRRQEQKEFDLMVARLRKEKEEEKQHQVHEQLDRLWHIQLVTCKDDIKNLKKDEIQEQLDIFKLLWNNQEIPLKSHIPNRPHKMEALEKALDRHLIRLAVLLPDDELLEPTSGPMAVDDPNYNENDNSLEAD